VCDEEDEQFFLDKNIGLFFLGARLCEPTEEIVRSSQIVCTGLLWMDKTGQVAPGDEARRVDCTVTCSGANLIEKARQL
jgi:hypothetical protein